MRAFVLMAALSGAIVLAACGSGSSSHTATVTQTTTVAVTVTAPSGSSSATQSQAKNLVVSPALRAQLIAAGAAMHQLPSSDYTGLIKGETFYAFDPATGIHWAGAGLEASPSSMKAQVGDQDDGAFLDFEQRPGGAWKAYPAGIPGSTNYSCAVTIPADVLAVWGWPSGTCHPPS